MNEFLYEFKLSGLVIGYHHDIETQNPYDKKKILYTPLIVEHDQAKSFFNEMNKGLVKQIETHAKEENISLLVAYGVAAFHNPYIKIECNNLIQTPTLKISHVTSGLGVFLSTINPDESFDAFLLKNFLGQYVSIHYVQTNKKELLQKFLLEEQIFDSKETKKVIKL